VAKVSPLLSAASFGASDVGVTDRLKLFNNVAGFNLTVLNHLAVDAAQLEFFADGGTDELQGVYAVPGGELLAGGMGLICGL
jgi:hypothetical protein